MYINNLITGSLTLGLGGSTPSGNPQTTVQYKYGDNISTRTYDITGELNSENCPYSIEEYIEDEEMPDWY